MSTPIVDEAAKVFAAAQLFWLTVNIAMPNPITTGASPISDRAGGTGDQPKR